MKLVKRRVQIIIKTIIFVFSLFFLFFTKNISAQGVQVAVLKFQNASEKIKETNFLSEQFAAIIESRLRREKRIQLQERRNLKDVLQEIELSQYGLFDESKEIEIGRLLRSDFLISGQYQITSEITKLIFRVINVDSGKVGFVGDITGDGIEFFKKLEAIAGMAAADILGERSASFTIDTRPSGSKIYADDNYIGESPIVGYPLTAGKHFIRTEMPFYHPYKNEIDMKEGERVEKRVSLNFKPYEYYKFRLNANVIFGGASTKLSKSHLPVRFPRGIQLGIEYFYNQFITGIFGAAFVADRENNIEVFDNEYIEDRSYGNFLIGMKFQYLYLFSPRYLAVLPGVSLSYRYIYDTLTYTEVQQSDSPPYDIVSSLLQPAFHLSFEPFPRKRFGFNFGITYMIAPYINSYNGSFSQFGVKTFDEVKVETSQLVFHFGATMYFNKRGKVN
ncbi:MAG: PEGA domain-containing protein [Spirochaetia bacterium]|nr:PEGA domain-containing protein [Spirochaetia bacterium]